MSLQPRLCYCWCRDIISSTMNTTSLMLIFFFAKSITDLRQLWHEVHEIVYQPRTTVPKLTKQCQTAYKKHVKKRSLKVIHFKLRLTMKLVASANLSIGNFSLSSVWAALGTYCHSQHLPHASLPHAHQLAPTPSRYSESCLNFLVPLSISEVTCFSFSPTCL